MNGVTEKSEDGQLMDVALNYGIETIASEDFNATDLVAKNRV